MRIADIVDSLDDPPGAIVVGTADTDEIAHHVAAALGLKVSAARPEQDAPVVVLVAGDELVGAVDQAVRRADGLTPSDNLLVLLPLGGAAPLDHTELPSSPVATVTSDHALELVEVIEIAHPTLGMALRFRASEDGELAVARSELLVQREAARRAHQAAEYAAGELERRGERIQALRAEVGELRERLETAEVAHERSVSAQDRELVALRREVGRLESSTSFRIGHVLVRLLQQPRLLLRIPARIARWLRS